MSAPDAVPPADRCSMRGVTANSHIMLFCGLPRGHADGHKDPWFVNRVAADEVWPTATLLDIGRV